MARTIRFHYRHLPHWEVEHGRYFVTVRCADSPPAEAVARLGEIADTLRKAAPASAQFAALQRATFRTLEKYLDQGSGSCPLKRSDVATALRDEFDALSEWEVGVPHFTIMPNYWHAMIVPPADNRRQLAAILKRIKGRSGRHIRTLIGGRGPIWQAEWFDRWMRNDAEWEKCVAYIRNNPVKAGLAPTWQEHPWTK